MREHRDQVEGRRGIGARIPQFAEILPHLQHFFVTLVRFDPVYYGHFKCNLRRVVDYPNLYGYLRDLYQIDGVAQTVDFDHIKRHYYYTHDDINPTRIVPIGPIMNLDAPHDRASLVAASGL